MPQLLMIDNDPQAHAAIAPQLREAGHRVFSSASGPAGLRMLTRQPIDLVLLEAELGRHSGFDICRQIRKFSDVPIIFRSARAEVQDRVIGLAIGADDYIAKALEPAELIARIDAVMRRCRNAQGAARARLGGKYFVLDQYSQRVIFGDSHAVELTPTEFRLLEYLMINARHILSPGQILSRVWERCDSTNYSLVSTYILRLRNKLELDPTNPRHIITVWNLGYKFEADPAMERG